MKMPFGKKQNDKTQIQNPQKSPAIEHLEKGMVSLVDVIAPSSVEVDFKYIRVGEKFFSTLFMVGYPRYVSPNWLQPIIDYDHTLDISMYCYPTSSSDVLSDIKRKIAEMEATIAGEAENGRPADPRVEAALEDALALQEELAKGVERFFQFSFYITLTADSLLELEDATKQLKTTLASLLLSAKTATLQMEEGFKTTIPFAQDRLYITRNMDTTSLASTFPFTSAVLTQNKGVMYGINQQNGSLIIFDRFSLENANEVVLGKSGAGKSYLIKLEIMRQFMLGTEVIVVDPEGEYEVLARTLGGEVVSFTSASPIKINPFDLSQLYEPGENELGLKILSLHGLLKLIMGQLDAEHDAILDKALVETYRQKGITPDPETQKKAPPLLEDLYKTLLGMETQVSKDMAYRLEKFIQGSASGIFNQPSNFDITNPLTIFSIKNLDDELRPIAMHIILDFVWTKVKKSLKKRLLILDEAWYMMKYEDSASFVYSIAKRARKYYLGLTTATQDVEDFLKTDYGKAVLTNSSIQILLKQGTAEVDMVGEVFYLSEGERELLLSADIGEGLFFAGQNHVAMKALAAQFEHEIITSNPQEVLNAQQFQAQQEQLVNENTSQSPVQEQPQPVMSPPAAVPLQTAPTTVPGQPPQPSQIP
ncbi:MAG: conjugal transfer ATP-binding protein TraC [Patescibacteria group bacterium]|nr:conjugal transfer ATP-binding protein TraC [Patescibacteria group bacterium]